LDSRSLVCADCGATFEFPPEEQQLFAERAFAPPKRCRACRARKRRRATTPDHARPAPRPQRAPLADSGAGMHSATCTVCGVATDVPFRPDGVRPVYCLPCLKQRTR
jgi:CxxC-x17-CxxC domain-containing protein